MALRQTLSEGPIEKTCHPFWYFQLYFWAQLSYISGVFTSCIW